MTINFQEALLDRADAIIQELDKLEGDPDLEPDELDAEHDGREPDDGY